MSQPLKQCPRTASVAWCATQAAPTLMALGSSASSAAGGFGGDGGSESTLDLVSFDLSKPGQNMDVVASVKTESGRRFNSLSWGALGADGPFPYGIIAGGLQDGVVSLWDPSKIINSHGADSGLLHSVALHQGAVNCVEFHPVKPNLMATCGADGEVNILNVENPASPQPFKPSDSTKTHHGSEVLSVAWNRKVPHILASCSNKGTTVVWDLKQKKEVISFQDPANRLRCSDVTWNPEKPTQLLVAYDDDRQPSMQMWDLRNVKYPFKETQGHTKGILGVSWSSTDPNLILSCGKDNRVVCWFNTAQGMDVFSEIHTPHTNFEVKWAPHKPSLIATASLNGSVALHSVQTQQNSSAKYCPSWYSKPCGVAFGFGGKMLAFGQKGAAAAVGAADVSSFCHSLVVPNEPEIVSTADRFESWRGERRLQEFCQEKTQRSAGHVDEGLMWNLLGLQFDDAGRTRLPALLGFDQERIEQEAERYLGKKPGTTLMGPPPEEEKAAASAAPAARNLGPDLSEQGADDFFKNLAESTEQERVAVEAAAAAAAVAAELALSTPTQDSVTNWSAGPESLIKQSLLVGNLTAAVECCFKSGRMAEALLLASGGGTTLWTRARDEYLRLQGDSFLTTVGNIMTNDFEKLVSSSDLKNWMETLAIIATYSQEKYPMLCEQLAHRLQTEAADIRSAVICYICAKNFSKTVSIWANTHVASSGSNKLALQDLVEKMTVLQEATKFNQADPLFNSKLTQYAEILANSGRLTAAMRFLTLLHDDASSSILRDRIYNSAPQQMSQMFGRPPAVPWQALDVRVLYQPPVQPQAVAAYGQMPQQQQQQQHFIHYGAQMAPMMGQAGMHIMGQVGAGGYCMMQPTQVMQPTQMLMAHPGMVMCGAPQHQQQQVISLEPACMSQQHHPQQQPPMQYVQIVEPSAPPSHAPVVADMSLPPPPACAPSC
mmetsp:Transcript_20665/g.53816  ORF Transcript_20665/g.53816 Transcript_20665/m.53816 type:complete len:945 (-) Transcript_20665:177-3011(-)